MNKKQQYYKLIILTLLRWLNTVFAHALALAIQHTHKLAKNKEGVSTATILFAQCPRYLYHFFFIIEHSIDGFTLLSLRYMYVRKGNDSKNPAILSFLICYLKNPVKCGACVVCRKSVIE